MNRAEDSDRWVRTVSCKLSPPSLKDNTADVDRLNKSIEKKLRTDRVSIGLSFVRRIPSLLRENRYEVCPLLYQDRGGWHLIDIYPSCTDLSMYGLGVDIGSSTVVVRLMDLMSGELIEEISFLNPQNETGPDILTRIHFASQEGGLDRLRTLLIEKLNQEIAKVAKRNGIGASAVVGLSVAGNTTMTHLFLGLDPYWICREPYIPVINRPELLRAADLDIEIHREAPALVFPNVGSYCGGDLIAGVLASGMAESDELSILVDVGTNAEVVIGNREWLMACAGAAGPALEGGVASMGMMAGPGVIDKVRIDAASGQFSMRTIENKPPIGICGSGLIDLVAQFFLVGMIDLRGKFVVNRCGDRLKEMDGVKHFVVVHSQDSGRGEDLTLSQPDIDALIRSKAAMYTILTTITHMLNVSTKDISRFYIAGTFGSYIDPESAITLGMIPDLPIETYKPLGNTALTGAVIALLSAAARDQIYGIRDRITYVELNVNQEFMNLFSAAKFIPHTDRSLFPSVQPPVQKWG
ncbi:MAG: ASKHA domain-containing protein [Desulfobacteraceae bacterium]|jgi:uncharacterized 2Fe-2S/4Fe-4S cluster protein (DUF4445 family)